MSLGRLVRAWTLILLLSIGLSAARCYAATGQVTGRALSLNALSLALRSGNRPDARALCGITRLTGYMADGKDLILLGETDPELPALCVDDLVVAVRNAWLKYARTEGDTQYYSVPGCSIDPPQSVLRDLGRVGVRLKSARTDDDCQACLDEWCNIGSRPQDVKVLGVPHDSRFAKTMVDADYLLKRLASGAAELKVGGFESLAGMTEKLAREELTKGNTSVGVDGTMNRFWFSPSEATYDTIGPVTVLKTCGIQVLTEEERLSEAGLVSGSGKAHPLAKRFAGFFTNDYREIASAEPVYAELESLFRFAALARLLKDSGARAAGLTYLLDTYRIEEVQVGRTVPGVTGVRKVVVEKDTSRGHTTYKLVLPSCGGVIMDVCPKPVRGARTDVKANGRASANPAGSSNLRKSILRSRKSTGALMWDFAVPAEVAQ